MYHERIEEASLSTDHLIRCLATIEACRNLAMLLLAFVTSS